MAKQERLALFLEKEAHELAELIKDIQGFSGLSISGHENLQLPKNRIKNWFFASQQKSPTIDCQINFAELPFPNEYFDVVILYHVFDEIDDIIAVLQEAKRVLRHDGLLLINGFERTRICARIMQRRLAQKTCITRKRYGLLDILAKLTELQFKHETFHFDFCRNKWLEKYLKYIVPFLGIGFWIKAKKEVASLTPLPEAAWELDTLLKPMAARPEYLSPQKQDIKS